MGVPVRNSVVCHFSLGAFNILCLIFVILITMCLGVFLLGFILTGINCASWIWLTISLLMLEKFSALISSNILGPFSLSSPSGTPCNASVGVLKVVPQVS